MDTRQSAVPCAMALARWVQKNATLVAGTKRKSAQPVRGLGSKNGGLLLLDGIVI